MHRLLIAAASLAFIAATAAPALADEYPPCSRTVTDKCRVVTEHEHGHHHGGGGGHHGHHGHGGGGGHHHHKGK